MVEAHSGTLQYPEYITILLLKTVSVILLLLTILLVISIISAITATINLAQLKKSYALTEDSWDLKDSQIPYTIKWEVVRRANSFSPVTKRCDLCIAEKLEIVYNQGMATLNKRHEVFNHCRHRVGKLLVKKKRRRRIPGE